MTKTGGKKKRAEKAKTKLKTSQKGAKQAAVRLGKGHNEVKFDLETKTLHLKGWKDFTEGATPEERKRQMEEGEKRLRPVKDLISRVGNHALSSRQDGLRGLKDWVKYKLPELETQLALVINRVTPLLSDREAAVRKDLVALFAYLLPALSPNTTEAFAAPISAHLCCALAHIDAEVQRDALRFLDTLVERAPAIIARCYAQVLPACVEQIVARRGGGGGSDGSARIGLSNAVSGKVLATEWRLSVFQRLENVLKVLEALKVSKAEESSVPVRSAEAYFGVFPEMSDSGLVLADLSSSVSTSETFNFCDFALKMSGILIDSWCEVAPSAGAKNKKNTNILTPDSAPILGKTLTILRLLLDLCDPKDDRTEVVKRTLEPKIHKFFVSCLPFFASGHPDLKTQHVDLLNLQVAEVYLRIGEDSSVADDPSLLRVLQYLHDMRSLHSSAEVSSSVCGVLRLLFERSNLLAQSSQIIDEILLRLWETSKPSNKVVGQLFYDLVKSFAGLEFPAVRAWVDAIGSWLVQGVTTRHHLETIGLLARRNETELLKEVFSAADEIMERLISQKVESGHTDLLVRTLAESACYSGSIRSKAVAQIPKMGHVVDQETMRYCCNILQVQN